MPDRDGDTTTSVRGVAVALGRRCPFTVAVVTAMLVVGLATTTIWNPAEQQPWYPNVAFGLPSFQSGRWWTLVRAVVRGCSDHLPPVDRLVRSSGRTNGMADRHEARCAVVCTGPVRSCARRGVVPVGVPRHRLDLGAAALPGARRRDSQPVRWRRSRCCPRASTHPGGYGCASCSSATSRCRSCTSARWPTSSTRSPSPSRCRSAVGCGHSDVQGGSGRSPTRREWRLIASVVLAVIAGIRSWSGCSRGTARSGRPPEPVDRWPKSSSSCW